MVYAPLIETVF